MERHVFDIKNHRAIYRYRGISNNPLIVHISISGRVHICGFDGRRLQSSQWLSGQVRRSTDLITADSNLPSAQ